MPPEATALTAGIADGRGTSTLMAATDTSMDEVPLLMAAHCKPKEHDEPPKHKGRTIGPVASRLGHKFNRSSPNPVTALKRRLVRLRTRNRLRTREPKTFVAASEDRAIAASEAENAGLGVGMTDAG